MIVIGRDFDPIWKLAPVLLLESCKRKRLSHNYLLRFGRLLVYLLACAALPECLDFAMVQSLAIVCERCGGKVQRIPLTRDVRGQLVILGTGTSVGVPTIGCGCEVCQSDDPRNKRTRCGLAIGLEHGNLLIDTPPDLRQQLLREGLGVASAVLFTHEHADHIFGLDDLRIFQFYLGQPLPLFCEESVEARIRQSFDYAFIDREQTHAGSVPQLVFKRITCAPFEIMGQLFTPIRLKHGPRFDVLGFRFGNIAYCTDTNHIPPESLSLLEGLDVLILDALRHRPHVTHFSLDEAVEVARQLKPKRTLFTHISHELDHAITNASLPHGMELAYDGQQIPLT